MAPLKLERENAAILVVDIQERLAQAMDTVALERTLKRATAAIVGARTLGLPIVVTEQYPKGLGPTCQSLKEALGPFAPVEKIRFSCALDEVVKQFLGRRQILMVGMETHVCVFQTARDFVDRGLSPFLLADAVLSRTVEDRRVGLELCKTVGAVVTTVESALFDVLGQAGTTEFKAISAAVK